MIGHLFDDAVHIVKVDFLQGISRLPTLQAGVGVLLGCHEVLVRVIQRLGQAGVTTHNVSHQIGGRVLRGERLAAVHTFGHEFGDADKVRPQFVVLPNDLVAHLLLAVPLHLLLFELRVHDAAHRRLGLALSELHAQVLGGGGFQLVLQLRQHLTLLAGKNRSGQELVVPD